MYEILFIHFISMTGTCFGFKASHRSKPVKDRVNHLFVNKRSVYAAAPESGWWEETVMSFQPERGISVERRGTHQGSSPLAPSTGKRLHKQRGGITCKRWELGNPCDSPCRICISGRSMQTELLSFATRQFNVNFAVKEHTLFFALDTGKNWLRLLYLSHKTNHT